MAYDENQTFLPESFSALYRDERQRLTEPKEAILGYYELCEDMAQMLVEHCRTVHFRDGVDERQVLERCHAGLVTQGSAFTEPQAEWVIRRTAELLEWQHWVPDFPTATGKA
jgi:hypothetical protein